MSPYELGPFREAFEAAAHRLGWTKHEVDQYHERDDRSWKENVWFSADGKYLFGEDRVSQGLVEEIIRLAKEATP